MVPHCPVATPTWEVTRPSDATDLNWSEILLAGSTLADSEPRTSKHPKPKPGKPGLLTRRLGAKREYFTGIKKRPHEVPLDPKDQYPLGSTCQDDETVRNSTTSVVGEDNSLVRLAGFGHQFLNLESIVVERPELGH